MTIEQIIEKESDVEKDNERNLIIHNDEVNEFGYVVESLIQICSHDPIQAEQCVLVAHLKGKCDVKKGSYNDLKIMKTQFVDRGIQVTID